MGSSVLLLPIAVSVRHASFRAPNGARQFLLMHSTVKGSMSELAGLPDDGSDRASTRASVVRDVSERLASLDGMGTGELEVVGVWHPSDGVCVTALAGEIDLANAGAISHTLEAHLWSQPSHLVIEMSRVAFIDSSGINELLTLARRLATNDRTVLLAAPSQAVTRVLEIVRVGDRLVVELSLDDALARLESPPHQSGRTPRDGQSPADDR
jgi:stage II sporulation protein AA (anti-sigma F factor antagonist)